MGSRLIVTALHGVKASFFCETSGKPYTYTYRVCLWFGHSHGYGSGSGYGYGSGSGYGYVYGWVLSMGICSTAQSLALVR